MVRFDVRRLVLGVLLGFGLAGAVLAVVTCLNGGVAITKCAFASPLGWTIPLGSLFVIAAVAWLLLSQTPRGQADADAAHLVGCPSCGRSVLADWRLCPYCGSSLAPAATAPSVEEPLRT